MRTIAHIIHPVVVDRSSDLNVAQPITFETMRLARKFASEQVQVRHYCTKYADENPAIPEGFRHTRDLDRSISDITDFRRQRKLALIKDILDRLYDATDAEYLIYTNLDIALMPYFYVVVNQLIDQGYDALVINRRSISSTFSKLEELPLMYSEVGEPHPGCDCFVFKRNCYRSFRLGTAFIGSSRIGLILAVNLYYNAKKFRQIRDAHLTFHIGNDRIWQDADLEDERLHNDNELKKILAHFDFDHNPPADPVLVERLIKVYDSQSFISLKKRLPVSLKKVIRKVTNFGRVR